MWQSLWSFYPMRGATADAGKWKRKTARALKAFRLLENSNKENGHCIIENEVLCGLLKLPRAGAIQSVLEHQGRPLRGRHLCVESWRMSRSEIDKRSVENFRQKDWHRKKHNGTWRNVSDWKSEQSLWLKGFRISMIWSDLCFKMITLGHYNEWFEEDRVVEDQISIIQYQHYSFKLRIYVFLPFLYLPNLGKHNHCIALYIPHFVFSPNFEK